jgi:LemA protein
MHYAAQLVIRRERGKSAGRMSGQLVEILCSGRKTCCELSCFADWRVLWDASRASKTEVLGSVELAATERSTASINARRGSQRATWFHRVFVEPIVVALLLSHTHRADLWFHGRKGSRMEWIIIGVAIAVVVIAILIFNNLVRMRNVVREGWSGIDVQLRRRTDLVPNLVETVKGYAAHERGLFEDVAKNRAQSIAADNVGGQAAAEKALQGSLGRLFAVAEAYPELKANKNFLELQQQLAEIEDQLQMARRYYNGAVRNLNIGIQSFPGVLLARPFGFREEPFFELDDRSQAAAPQVSLGAES